MNEKLKKIIIEENRDLHKVEAKYYDELHKEIFNRFQTKLNKDLVFRAFSAIGKQRDQIKVLDIGCGTGLFLIPLLKEGCNVKGIDLSDEMIKICRKKCRLNGYNPVLECAEAEEYLLSEREEYDMIIFSSVLHHLPDYMNVIKLALHRLRRNGVILITHEPLPLKHKKTSKISELFKKVDDYFYIKKLNHTSYEKLQSLNYGFSDYHVEKGIDIDRLMEELEVKKVDVRYYYKHDTTLRSGVLGYLLNQFKLSVEGFSLIIQKNYDQTENQINAFNDQAEVVSKSKIKVGLKVKDATSSNSLGNEVWLYNIATENESYIDFDSLNKQGEWTIIRDKNSPTGEKIFSNEIGATMEFHITGSKMILKCLNHPWSGVLEIYKENRKMDEINLYSEEQVIKDIEIKLN